MSQEVNSLYTIILNSPYKLGIEAHCKILDFLDLYRVTSLHDPLKKIL